MNYVYFDHCVRPQDDLYHYVNGGWISNSVIPDDKMYIGAVSELRDEAERSILEICENLAQGKLDKVEADEHKVALLFSSFMDQNRINQLGRTPVLPFLARIGSISTLDDLRDWFGWCLRYGVSTLMKAWVEVDPNNSKENTLFLGQRGLGMPNSSYYQSDRSEDKIAYFSHVAQLFALSEGRNKVIDDDLDSAKGVLSLEERIARCHLDIEKVRDMTTLQYQSREELNRKSPELGWDRIFKSAGIAEVVKGVVNRQPAFFAKVGAVLVEEPLWKWRAWARYHFLDSMAPYLSEEFVAQKFSFSGKFLMGQDQNRTRCKRAISFVDAVMGDVLGKLYIQQHYSSIAEKKIIEIVSNIVDTYRNAITSLSWMEPSTKVEALRKLSLLRIKMGYPKKSRDYSALEVGSDLISNVLAVGEFITDYYIGKLSQPVDPDEWVLHAHSVNAYYHLLRNEIVFPAGILQPPFFDENADDAINYGGIGATIAHEIGHAFDDQGSHCDADGRLRDWWTSTDHKVFLGIIDALAKQYSDVSPSQLPDSRVNGRLTVGESVGDVGGLQIAVKAWQMTRGSDSEKIEINGYTPMQRMFLSWASCWRQKVRDQFLLTSMRTNVHPPNEVRCNQAIRNVDDFYEAFSITESDDEYLDPDSRIVIW